MSPITAAIDHFARVSHEGELAKLCVALTAADDLGDELLVWRALARVTDCVRRDPVLSRFVQGAREEMMGRNQESVNG